MYDILLEYVEIPDSSPEEMARFYVDTVNKAYQEVRSGISKRYGEMMEVSLYSDWKIEFKGKYFVVLEWKTTRYPTKEEFFGEDVV